MTDRCSEQRADRLWFRQDVDELSDWVDLGEEHGPAGIAVMLALKGAAKVQDDGGGVQMRWRGLARAAYLPGGATEAREVVRTAARVGLVVLVTDDDTGFSLLVDGWADRQRPRPKTPAERQRARRERLQAQQEPRHDRHADVTAERDMSRDRHLTGTDTATGVNPLTGVVAPARVRAREAEAHPPTGIAEVRDRVVEILRTCPRFRFDPLCAGVENAIAAWPSKDPVQAAHIAVTRGSDPTYRTVDAGRALEYALRDLPDPKPPPAARGAPRSTADADIARYLDLADTLEAKEAAR